MSEHREVQKKANQYFFTKVIIDALLIILGAILISSFLRRMQHDTALYKQRQSSEEALNETVELLAENSTEIMNLTGIFHDSNQDMLDDLRELLESGLFNDLATADNDERTAAFRDICGRAGVDYLLIADSEGKVVISPQRWHVGKSLKNTGLISLENTEAVLRGTKQADGTVIPVEENTGSEKYYFYSVPVTYYDDMYAIVLGAKAEVLDVQIASLRDMSAVLSNAAVYNDGFMFAVDAEDDTFLYYPDDNGSMKGTNAFETGLSEEALQDGYAGRQTINGSVYYCVSKQFEDSVIICAVADTENIYYNDRYVLFWSNTGFILVMLLCLIYAIIVRNDFVRKAVETDRKVIGHRRGGKVYFDRSIFRRVFPLMIAGVLLIFGISFYTQTLLEIGESIKASNVALDEVISRYQESSKNRSLIREYYNSRFLSKAKLISYLIQEDPTVLNEETDRYHTGYDENNERYFILDDEGNPLRSVSESPRLKELCEANGIASVYIFNADGRVIATNTPNWYFAVSHDPEEQSYVFLDVLDGKTDALIQDAMEDDMGEQNQYIGVKLVYYTAKDDQGETAYVPHKVYEAYKEGREMSLLTSPVVQHSSMLQIGLNRETSEKIFASTDAASVLSSDMLSGGFIILFDNTEEHKCVYSPNEASIGKTAEELDISDNAFSGLDYYGFRRVNGTTYFFYFRYVDNYYIATATPKSEMYQMRLLISGITALTSLLLILILSATVTVTTEEEEMLYATMSESEAAKGLDSAIFNIILPSGKQTSTTKAAARWNNRWIPWDEKSPEQKLLLMISLMIGLMAVYVAVSVVGANKLFKDGSVIQYILSMNWDREVNVFAFSASVIVLVIVAIMAVLFRIPVQMASSLLGARGETVAHLLLSVVKYGGTIFAIFYCLYLNGMDAQNLLASAGILSLVIGLGAQSLIKDIIAGIFIVFEGEFRVGDIVTIGGFRGTVMDIGLRTTKIMGVDGNIKIFNNSDINGVLNMTKEASYAFSRISIEYGQDISYVESVLARELPKLKEKNPQILDGPTYAGITELGASGITLGIWSKCSESNVIRVTRYMNREILEIFYRNNITVPYPHMTVTGLDGYPPYPVKDTSKEEDDLPDNEPQKE
ncbi:MAG: mechanosensitive ion channel family protein [Solobacterium sp.]|nr:mechanosensitive ion channel family protein [Solobacterium sp.]